MALLSEEMDSDLLRLWGLVAELSEQLNANRSMTAALQAQAAQAKVCVMHDELKLLSGLWRVLLWLIMRTCVARALGPGHSFWDRLRPQTVQYGPFARCVDQNCL